MRHLRYQTFFCSLIFLGLVLFSWIGAPKWSPRSADESMRFMFALIGAGIINVAMFISIYLLQIPEERQWTKSWEIIATITIQSAICLLCAFEIVTTSTALSWLMLFSFVLFLRDWMVQPQDPA
jgi:hypothetical protein